MAGVCPSIPLPHLGMRGIWWWGVLQEGWGLQERKRQKEPEFWLRHFKEEKTLLSDSVF